MVSSVVEVEGTPLTAGIEEAAVEVAATGLQGFFMASADNVSGNPVVVDQPLPISTQEPAEVADPERRRAPHLRDWRPRRQDNCRLCRLGRDGRRDEEHSRELLRH